MSSLSSVDSESGYAGYGATGRPVTVSVQRGLQQVAVRLQSSISSTRLVSAVAAKFGLQDPLVAWSLSPSAALPKVARLSSMVHLTSALDASPSGSTTTITIVEGSHSGTTTAAPLQNAQPLSPTSATVAYLRMTAASTAPGHAFTFAHGGGILGGSALGDVGMAGRLGGGATPVSSALGQLGLSAGLAGPLSTGLAPLAGQGGAASASSLPGDGILGGGLDASLGTGLGLGLGFSLSGLGLATLGRGLLTGASGTEPASPSLSLSLREEQDEAGQGAQQEQPKPKAQRKGKGAPASIPAPAPAPSSITRGMRWRAEHALPPALTAAAAAPGALSPAQAPASAVSAPSTVVRGQQGAGGAGSTTATTSSDSTMVDSVATATTAAASSAPAQTGPKAKKAEGKGKEAQADKRKSPKARAAASMAGRVQQPLVAAAAPHGDHDHDHGDGEDDDHGPNRNFRTCLMPSCLDHVPAGKTREEMPMHDDGKGEQKYPGFKRAEHFTFHVRNPGTAKSPIAPLEDPKLRSHAHYFIGLDVARYREMATAEGALIALGLVPTQVPYAIMSYRPPRSTKPPKEGARKRKEKEEPKPQPGDEICLGCGAHKPAVIRRRDGRVTGGWVPADHAACYAVLSTFVQEVDEAMQ